MLLQMMGTVGGLFHPVASLKKIIEVVHVDARIGRRAERHQFPEEHAEAPDVGLARVDVIGQGLGRHPLNRHCTLINLLLVSPSLCDLRPQQTNA